MMGASHAASGILVGAATLPHAPIPNMLAAQAAWVAAVGGMAMLPDLDHHSSTVASMWGTPSRAAAAGVGACAGGHRNGTHSLPGVTVLTLLAWAATDWLGQWGQLTVIALAIGVALYAATPIIPNKVGKMRVEGTLLAANIVVSWVGAWWLWSNNPTVGEWLPWAVAVGCLTHIAGDIPTHGGVPLLWPVRWRVSLGLWKTGNRFETAVVAPGMVAAAVLVLNHNGLLGVSAVVDGLAGLLTRVPALDEQVAAVGATTVAAALVAAGAAYVAAKDKRAWGMVT